MDASSVQSGSKCGSSDFSIERILADRKDSREDSEAPEWLCCTRYRPPRLPRSAAVCRARRAGRHARVPFTAAQAAALEAAYARAPYLAPPALKALAAALQLRDDRIKIWFQNRRARERREKSTTIAPPQGVTLPSTTASFAPTWIPQSNQPNFVTPPAQILFNAQKLESNINSAKASERVISHSLSSQRLVLSNFDDRRLGPGYDFNGDDTSRPGTPLDIESVED